MLAAEVTAQLERQHAVVLEQILAMPEWERHPWNRACWDTGAIKLSDRVDELFELLAPVETTAPAVPARYSSTSQRAALAANVDNPSRAPLAAHRSERTGPQAARETGASGGGSI